MPSHHWTTAILRLALIVYVCLGSVGPLQARTAQRAEQPSAVAPVAVGGDIRQPEPIRSVDPIYPPAARSAGIQGVVLIEVTIGPDGRVMNAKVLKGHPALTQAALDAVQRWEYEPTVVDGMPVPVLTRAAVNFHLSSRGGLESFGQLGDGLPIAPLCDLTGEWRGDDGGTYQVRTVGDEMFWSGADAQEKWANVFHGSLTAGDEYSGRWADVPPGTSRGSGAISIRVVCPNEFVLVGNLGEFSGRRWQRTSKF